MRGPPRLLRVLLRLYPRRHRETYGAEMWDVVRHRYQTGHARGWARVRLHAEVAADLVWNAARLWTTELGRMTMGRGRGGWGLDVRFVLRALRRRPGYTITALAVLAGAVAVNASVFSYVRGTLLAEPTYPGADRLVIVWGSNPTEGQVRDVISGPDYLDLARENSSLESIAAFHIDGAGVPDADGHPQVYDAETVSASFFQVVPVQPALGRVFDARERNSGGERTVVVSWAFWRDHLGQDPAWLGRSLTIEGEPHTVIGVLPEDFQFLLPVAFWLPLYDDVLAADDPSHIHYNALGRMRPGVTAQDVTRDLAAVQRRTNERRGGSQGWSILAERLHETSVMAIRSILWTVTGAVGLVLLIALVNLATLFRIRTLGRDDELGVRLALGASRGRVARILALESGVLALCGAALGLLAAPLMLARARELLPVWVPIPDSAARVPVLQAVLDPAVAGTSLGLALLGALALTAPGLVRAVRARGAARGGEAGSVPVGPGGWWPWSWRWPRCFAWARCSPPAARHACWPRTWASEIRAC